MSRYYPGGCTDKCDPVYNKRGEEIGVISIPLEYYGESVKTGNSRWFVEVQEEDCTTFCTYVTERAVRQVDFGDPIVEWVESD
jgi:hypothetical protein